MPISHLSSHPLFSISGANSNEVQNPDTSIGSSLLSSRQNLDWLQSRNALENQLTVSSAEALLQMHTYGRTTPQSPTRDLNWESENSSETQSTTGNQFERSQSPEIWKTSLLMCTCARTTTSSELVSTTFNQLVSSEKWWCSGVALAQGSLEGPGTKQVIYPYTYISYILGLQAYPKDPRSKFWDGYRGQAHVVIDEFRGGIDIAHLLRWFDRYPVIVEVKGSSVVLNAKKIWITSNLAPEAWYPDTDQETIAALRRRINVTHFP